jgi:hypothetical protein
MRVILKPLVAAAFVVMIVAGAEAQSCRGSHVTYLIRDAKGRSIDAASSAVAFTGGASQASKYWKVSQKQWARPDSVTLPPTVAELNGKLAGLTTSQFCNFREPVTLNLTIGGKTMELTFKFPRMGDQQSADFIVDALRFKAGKYEIDLAMPANGYAAYYAATGWKVVR